MKGNNYTRTIMRSLHRELWSSIGNPIQSFALGAEVQSLVAEAWLCVHMAESSIPNTSGNGFLLIILFGHYEFHIL